MKHMIGICYESKYKMWMTYDIHFCRCGNHVCKSLIQGNNKENILKGIKEMMEQQGVKVKMVSKEEIIKQMDELCIVRRDLRDKFEMEDKRLTKLLCELFEKYPRD